MLLGLDLGTSSIKALLLSPDGAVCGQASAPYPVRAPQPGWAESAPEDWWPAAATATRAAVGDRGAEVSAVGLSGQMHGVVLCGGDGEPLRPAILWADARSEAQLELYRRLAPDLRRRLGNPLVAGMAGPSLAWLRRHEPERYGPARWALQPKDWLRLRLTGEACTDPSDASATLLYDLEAGAWSAGVIEALGLRPELLAPVRPSASLAGGLTARAAAHLGLRAGVPVAVGAADTAAALLGSGVGEPGTAQLSIGTGAQLVAPQDPLVVDPDLRTHRYRTARARGWYAMAAMQNAGLALEFARRVLGLSWPEAYEEAFGLPAGAGPTFLPYLTGERTPHLDAQVRGGWVGLGLHHTRGHLMRAAFAGVAFAVRDGLEALERSGVPVRQLCLAGGGTFDPRWRQLLADTLGRPLSTLEVSGASARGAALLAGLATGHWVEADLAALTQRPQLAALPGAGQPQAEEDYARFQALYPRLRGWPDQTPMGLEPLAMLPERPASERF